MSYDPYKYQSPYVDYPKPEPDQTFMQRLLGDDPMQSLFGSKEQLGIIPGVSGAVSGLANAYTGYQSLKLGQKAFEHGKALDLANLNNSAQATNAELRRRERLRLSTEGIRATDTQLDRFIKEKGAVRSY